MMHLSPLMKKVLAGKTDTPTDRVCELRELMARQGVELPDWRGEKKASKTDRTIRRVPKHSPKRVRQNAQTYEGRRGLGDKVSGALARFGVTEERVSDWLGRPCACPERIKKLNALNFWVEDTAKDTVTAAKDKLFKLLGGGE